MPSQLAHPGVYIEEVPSRTRPITGVATSIAAFVGRTSRGPFDEPLLLHSWAAFEREFGGVWLGSPLGHAVRATSTSTVDAMPSSSASTSRPIRLTAIHLQTELPDSRSPRTSPSLPPPPAPGATPCASA